MKSIKEFLNQMSPVIVVYYADGTIDKVYPVDEKEVKESIESWNQSLYFGDIIKFEVVYETVVNNKNFRYTYTYTEYGLEPFVNTEIS